MTKSNTDKSVLREPGIKRKNKKPTIPDSFAISRPVSPMRAILDQLDETVVRQDSSNSLPHDGSNQVRLNSIAAVQPYEGQHRTAVQPHDGSTLVRQSDQNHLPYKGSKAEPTNGKVKLTIRMNAVLLQKIKDYCYSTHENVQQFIETAAIREFECRMASGPNQPLYGGTAHDDLMMRFKTHEDIIMRFEKFAGRKWSSQDDRIGPKYAEADRKLMDIAFIRTVEAKLRGNTAHKPIRSFNYFTTELDGVLEESVQGKLPGGIEAYHRYILGKWESYVLPLRKKKWGF